MQVVCLGVESWDRPWTWGLGLVWGWSGQACSDTWLVGSSWTALPTSQGEVSVQSCPLSLEALAAQHRGSLPEGLGPGQALDGLLQLYSAPGSWGSPASEPQSSKCTLRVGC